MVVVVVPLPRKLFLRPFIFIEFTMSNFHCRDPCSLSQSFEYIRSRLSNYHCYYPHKSVHEIFLSIETANPPLVISRNARLIYQRPLENDSLRGKGRHYSKEVAVGGHSNRSFPRPSIETFESRLGRKKESKKEGRKRDVATRLEKV